MWECSFWPDGDLDGGPGVWINATTASHAASLFRIDLAQHAPDRKGTIVVHDKSGREVHRAVWPGNAKK
jgi:hypothetical protein